MSDPRAGQDSDVHPQRQPATRRRGRPQPARRRQTNPGPRGALAALREAVLVIVAALVLSLLVKTFLVQAFYIPSESMKDTLLIGDRVLVEQLTPTPFALHRGDVVVFDDADGWLRADGTAPTTTRSGPAAALAGALTFIGVLPDASEEHLVKRVIGLPGDHVVCCDAAGRTIVNGVALDEIAYLAPGAIPSERAFDVVVPAGRLWVEGDNRQRSGDSRYHQGLPGGGSVAESAVVGRAVVRVWPLDRLGWLSDHSGVFAAVPAAVGAAGN